MSIICLKTAVYGKMHMLSDGSKNLAGTRRWKRNAEKSEFGINVISVSPSALCEQARSVSRILQIVVYSPIEACIHASSYCWYSYLDRTGQSLRILIHILHATSKVSLSGEMLFLLRISCWMYNAETAVCIVDCLHNQLWNSPETRLISMSILYV